MSWREIDEYLGKIFHSRKEKPLILGEKEPDDLVIVSNEFNSWLDEFMIEMDNYDEFEQDRLICVFCKCKINNDKFVMMQNPKFPNNKNRQLYFHSKGKCDPRHRYLKEARELWLFRYNYP